MSKVINGVASEYDIPMYYEPKFTSSRQACKTQQMFYELNIELSKKTRTIEELKIWLNEEIKRIDGIRNPRKGLKPYGDEEYAYSVAINSYKYVLEKIEELEKLEGGKHDKRTNGIIYENNSNK